MLMNDLEDVYEAMRLDGAFGDLRRGRNPLVPGEGRQPCRVFIVGEAPGADEVMALRPLVGPSGKVLRQLMAEAGLYSTVDQRAPNKLPNCWLTNAVKYRPPRNRTPTLAEVMISRPYLLREWQLVGKPSVIIAVGAVALTAIRGEPASISAVAGKPVTKNGRTLWPMFHPAFGLRGNETVKATIEAHWEQFAEWLDENNSR